MDNSLQHFAPCRHVQKIIKIELAIKVLQIINPDIHGIDNLPCTLCMQGIGEKRPIAVGMGYHGDRNTEQGFRLCSDCLQEQQKAGKL